MRHEFTPASERALEEAAHWARAPREENSGTPSTGDVGLPELLMGLLSQTECRAASMLAAHGIDSGAVRRRWPELVRLDSPPSNRRFDVASPAMRCSFQAVEERMFAYPRPLALATEQLLLGILAVSGNVSQWLAEHSFDADELEAEIHRLHGHSSAPLPCEPLVEASAETSGRTKLDLSDHAGAHWTTGTNAAADSRAFDAPGAASKPSRRAANDNLPPQSSHVLETQTSDVQAYRILDAAANRAVEALRVVEDYARFALDDRHLTGVCKHLRHQLTDALSAVEPRLRLACRDTQHDVGRELSTEGERRRASLASVVAASCSRLQESLRSLEEYGKLVSPRLGETVKQIRYESYTLQRAVETTRRSRKRLVDARLYVLVDGRESPSEFQRLVRSLVAAGVHIIQLRDKRLPDNELLQRARFLRRVTRTSPTLFIMNDRADLAVLARADGVHLGQDELTIKDARSIMGPEVLVGVSTHSLDQARRAVLDGADYIGVGPAFPSQTKQFDQFVGVELLKAVASEMRLPAFAIGGVDRGNVAEVLRTGIGRVAVSGAILGAEDPAAAAGELLQILVRDHAPAAVPEANENLPESTPRP